MSKSTMCNKQQTGVEVKTATESQHCIAAADTAASRTAIDEDDVQYYNEAGLT